VWCHARLASYKKPTQPLLLDSLPRNASGQVLKPVLRERVAEYLVAPDTA